MNDKTISKISFFILIIGLLLFFFFYEEEYKERNLSEIIDNNLSAKIFGRVDYVIFANDSTKFIFSQDKKITVFYPYSISISKGDFVHIYGNMQTYKGKREFLAKKVLKE
jgi:hypothetical protein